MFDAYPGKRYYTDTRPHCFNGSRCRKTNCDYVHPDTSERSSTSYTNPHAQNSYQSREDFGKWVRFTDTNSTKIRQLKSKFPDYLKKIKEGLYLQPEEKELQYLIHRRDKHSGDIHKGQCYLMCGDFRMYRQLSRKLYFGQYSAKTWRQVEAIDPGYIDNLCKRPYIGSQDLKIAAYICRERKAYNQILLKRRQMDQAQGKERRDDLSEKRSRSRQRK